MKRRSVFISMLLLASVIVSAQENDLLYSFEDNKTELIGFKDMNGNVKIEPKFGFFTHVEKFDKIIAVAEPKSDGGFKSYYLTKTGKKVGSESMYIYDNCFDCESEGYIRFKDHKIKKVGLFDGDGNVIIPPVYNIISQVHNGVMFALSGAVIKRDGEHFSFVGGVETLIDINNNVLIEDFPFDENINLYSMFIEDDNHSTSPIRDYFIGVNGKTYSFINYKKEFRYWFESVLKEELTKEKIKNHFFDKVSYWDDKYGWVSSPKKDLESEFVQNIIAKLNKTKIKNAKYNLFLQDLNKFIYESKEFVLYYDNCTDALTSKYPVINVVVDGTKNNEYVQDHFEFLRTQDGYKLVGVSIRSQ